MKSDELNASIAKFQGSGENRVEKRKYDEVEERVYINKTQYFECIENYDWRRSYWIFYTKSSDRVAFRIS